MARQKPYARASLDDKQQEQYDRIARMRKPSADGMFGGPFDVWLASPEVADRMLSFGNFIWTRTSLPRGLIELAICVTGRFWRSNVEWVAHARLALDNGIAQHVIDDVFAERRPQRASAEELLVYDVSRALHNTHELPIELFRAAVETFGERGLVDIIATIGYYTTVSMTLNAFDVDVGAGVTPPFPKT